MTRLVPTNIFNELRNDPFLVGFDQIFDRIVSTGAATAQSPSYPPYNIVRNDNSDSFAIEIALAGFSKDEIDIESRENVLKIESKSRPEGDDEKEYLYKGISNKRFKKAFTLSDDVVVNGADMKDGILKIDMERIIPEEKKPRTIKIK